MGTHTHTDPMRRTRWSIREKYGQTAGDRQTGTEARSTAGQRCGAWSACPGQRKSHVQLRPVPHPPHLQPLASVCLYLSNKPALLPFSDLEGFLYLCQKCLCLFCSPRLRAAVLPLARQRVLHSLAPTVTWSRLDARVQGPPYGLGSCLLRPQSCGWTVPPHPLPWGPASSYRGDSGQVSAKVPEQIGAPPRSTAGFGRPLTQGASSIWVERGVVGALQLVLSSDPSGLVPRLPGPSLPTPSPVPHQRGHPPTHATRVRADGANTGTACRRPRPQVCPMPRSHWCLTGRS